MLDDKQFLFIIGSPRSGTTMLQLLIASHPQVAATVEQTIFQSYVRPWLDAWHDEVHHTGADGWELGLSKLFNERDLHNFLRRFLQEVYSRVLAKKQSATHILDKHPGYSHQVNTIRSFLPRARFIHIIRDGRDVAASMRVLHKKMNVGPSEIADAARKWKDFVNAAGMARAFGCDYLEIRFEEYILNKTGTFRKVLEFCDLPCSESWIEQTIGKNTFARMRDSGVSPDPEITLSRNRYGSGTAGSWYADFTSHDRFVFDQIAGDLLYTLGYAQPEWWAETLLDRMVEPWRFRWTKRAPYLHKALAYTKAALLGQGTR